MLNLLKKGAGKDQHERDICRRAVQLEEEAKERRLSEAASLRIELQKTQEQQERQRIQRETAKVFFGTVIQVEDTERRRGWSSRFWCRMMEDSREDEATQIERPETAEQFCQKLRERHSQIPIRVTFWQRLLRLLKKIICCNLLGTL